MAAKIGIFKGKSTLELRVNEDDDFPLVSFQMRKAKLIYEHMNAIKAFVESDGKRIE